MRLALYQPDIPQNTGAILRLCACLGVAADLIEPFGSAGRGSSPFVYWSIQLPSARPRQELDSFLEWVADAARETRLAIGEEHATRAAVPTA